MVQPLKCLSVLSQDIPVPNVFALLFFTLMGKIPVRQTPVKLHEDHQWGFQKHRNELRAQVSLAVTGVGAPKALRCFPPRELASWKR